jgi:hypothetical protein
MSLVKSWSQEVSQQLVEKLELKESDSPKSLRTLISPVSPAPVGEVREWRDTRRAYHLVYVGLTVPMIHLDSHMIFCFSAPQSYLPHFTLDAVKSGEHYAFHIDLIPRVELATNLEYTLKVYEPLTAYRDHGLSTEGLTPAQLKPIQFTVMSPWMLAHRATAGALDCMRLTAQKYLDHWLSLTQESWSSPSFHGDLSLEKRDFLHRSNLFNKKVDPVWSQVERLLGTATSEGIRQLLVGPIPDDGDKPL